MGRHSDDSVLKLIEYLKIKGLTLGFIVETEYPLIPGIYYSDLVWKIHDDQPPLFSFEIETRDSPAMFKNTCKYFETPSNLIIKPWHHFIIILKGKMSKGNRLALSNIMNRHNIKLFENIDNNKEEMNRLDKELLSVSFHGLSSVSMNFLEKQYHESMDIFESNIRKFMPIYQVLKFDVEREMRNIQMRFIVDFSDIYVFLFPNINRSSEYIGHIFYMFQNRLKNDLYILSPFSAFEILHWMMQFINTNKNYSFKQLKEDYLISDFINLIKMPSQNIENIYEKLRTLYEKIGGLNSLLMLVNTEKLELIFSSAIKRLRNMIHNKTIIPLENVVENYADFNIHNNVYFTALKELEGARMFKNINNIIDASNMSLTYQLTDKLLKKDEYFALITHSPITSRTFSHFPGPKDPYKVPLIRNPLYMTTRSIYKEEYPEKRELKKILQTGLESMDYLITNIEMLELSGRLTRIPIIHRKEFLEYDLQPLVVYLDRLKFFGNEYLPLMNTIIRINEEKIWGVKSRPNDLDNAFNVLTNKEIYEDRMMNAYNILLRCLRDTYRLLKDFTDIKYKHLLTSEIEDILEKIKKL